MNATYLRMLASRCRASGRDCADLFAKEEFRHLATELEATARELEGRANIKEGVAEAWQRSQPSRGFAGEH